MEVDDPISESALGEEFEPGTNAVRQCPLSAADEDRIKEQVAFVDQAGGQRLRGERGTPDRDIESG